MESIRVVEIDKEIKRKTKEIAEKHAEVLKLNRELKELENTKYEIETGRKTVKIKGINYIRFSGETLPVHHPKCGGTLTFLKDLEVGRQFHVANGHWTGEIINEEGINKIHVIETGKLYKIKDTDYLWID